MFSLLPVHKKWPKNLSALFISCLQSQALILIFVPEDRVEDTASFPISPFSAFCLFVANSQDDSLEDNP